MKNTFQAPFGKKLGKLQIRPGASVAVAVGLKSSANAVLPWKRKTLSTKTKNRKWDEKLTNLKLCFIKIDHSVTYIK